jgi:hypothetical protein
MLKQKMQAMRCPQVPSPPLYERPHENVESTWWEMVTFVGLLAVLTFCYFFGSLSLIPGICLVRERVTINISKATVLPMPQPKEFSTPA